MLAFIVNFESMGKRSSGKNCDKFPNIWMIMDPLLLLVVDGSLAMITDCCKAINHFRPESEKFATRE
jgi:hypothetical protein